jgi:uroporphyrinogen-III synthase
VTNSSAPLVVLTRPLELQASWRSALELAGLACASYPLTRIEPLPQLEDLRAQLAAAALVIVAARLIAVPGTGTEQAVRQQNYSGKVIYNNHNGLFFDANSMLLELAKHALDGAVVVLRGQPPATDPLMDGLAQLGLAARALALYRTPRLAADLMLESARRTQLEALLAQRPVWLMAQSAAVTFLQEEALAVTPQGLDGQRCVAIHPRIAQTATLAGFSSVILSGPALDQLASAVKSARD